jgi:hypothetical protein
MPKIKAEGKIFEVAQGTNLREIMGRSRYTQDHKEAIISISLINSIKGEIR